MNYKMFVIFFSCMILLSFISAESFGTFKQGEEIRISFNCNNATYFNISSITYPNSSVSVSDLPMSYFGNGEYNLTFSFTEDIGRYNVKAISDGCDETYYDYFLISSNGEDPTYSYLIASIFLILTFIGFGLLIHRDREKMEEEKYWDKMVKRYMEKNYLRFSSAVLWYNLKKNYYVLYYLIGLVIMLMVNDISLVFNLTAIYPVFNILLVLYILGALPVVIVFFGQVQEWLKDWSDKLNKINWEGFIDG